MSVRPLIPRQKLFDNPTFFGAKLSPDGGFVSWLAPADGVLNVWVSPADNIAGGQPVTRTKGRPINWQDWSPDGRYIMFLNDENGDENLHLFVVDPCTGELRDLTPFAGIRAMPTHWSHITPDKIAIGLNDRDTRWHDVYLLDLATGQRSLIWENRQEFLSVGLDWQLKPRQARSNAADGGARLWRLDGEQVTPWRDVPFDASLTTWTMRFDAAGKHLYMISSIERDKAAVVQVDWASGEERALFRSDRADVTDLISNSQTFEPLAVAIDSGRQQWEALGPAVAGELALIKARLPGHAFHIQSQTNDDRRWIVMSYTAEQAATYHLLDRDQQTLTELFKARPELKPYRLAPMHAVKAKSRDGLDLVSYLTLPADIETDRPPRPLPMVLVVHGGPWARDIFGYRGDHQWLADRGYAVLSVNYRGSTGFGKAFVAASEKQHARKIHDDLIDMVEWAIDQGIALRDKIAIFGLSYGGYASFVGATFTPEVFCCAVPVVGISNLQTLLESMPPYWAGFAEYMYRSYGDPRTEQGRRLLAERSPIHKVDSIKNPMLIFHGANDVRCKVAESDTIVAAMQAKNIPVGYVVYPDEGHGFAKPQNRLSYIAMTEAFLAQHLGGAFEPIGHDLYGSSHEIRAGAEALARAMRHIPLRPQPWSADAARSAIEEIVTDALIHFDAKRFWPVHPLDDEQSESDATFYTGATGMIWGLHYLARIGATGTEINFCAMLPDLIEASKAQFASRSPGYAGHGSLLKGDMGTALLAMRLAPTAALADLIETRAKANMTLPVRELMWGMPGSMLACVHMAEMTDQPRWQNLFRAQAARLLDELEETPNGPLWTQDLYGSHRQFLGPVHGYAGNMIPLLRGWDWLSAEQRQHIAEVVPRTLAANAWTLTPGVSWRPGAERRPGPPLLCQHCHGAPGMVTTFADAPFASPELEHLLIGGGEFAWAAGPLAKGSNLCHGTGGNGYAFLKLHRRTKDPVWIERARAFAMTAIGQCREARDQLGRGRFSLWTGDLGLAVYLWDCLTAEPKFPTIDVF